MIKLNFTFAIDYDMFFCAFSSELILKWAVNFCQFSGKAKTVGHVDWLKK